MELEIHLQPEWRDCLHDHVSEESGIHSALERAVELLGGIETPDEFVVTCNENEVPALRQAAQTHCPRPSSLSTLQSIDLVYTGRREITLDTDAVGGDMIKTERHAIFIRHRSS